MPDRTWKKAERKVAELVDGRRLPVSGRGGQPDILNVRLAIEVKHRRTLPQWLLDALRQAEQAATPGQLAVVVLHQRGQRYADSLVIVRLKAFREWLGWAERVAQDGRA